ncbi:MAG TPA: hypothetical protein VK277_06380 [Acidimicrobiales bacterium]|nr:hypothetical protein [Acidimicrobiales bacterium]
MTDEGGAPPADDATPATTAPTQRDASPRAFPSLSGPTADWPVRAADAVDRVVDTIRDRAVRPVLVGARAVVFGLLLAVVAVVLIVVGSVGFIRLLDVYLWPGKVWASYFVLGFIFVAVGAFFWTKRSGRPAADA